MATLTRPIPSRQLLIAMLRPHSLRRCPHIPISTRLSSTTNSSKPIVLEPPDKFRPPSHPQRLNKRAPRNYPGQPLSAPERDQQRTKRYPHTFPAQGTVLYRFLTSRWIHVWITVGFLTLLSLITLTHSFYATSPFAHLLPSIASFPLHPLRFVREWWGVYRMHVIYNSEQVDARRHQGVLDAQYRRLYRRAHGMENTDVEEDSGIDVTGLVPWDDGLTDRERARGGRGGGWRRGGLGEGGNVMAGGVQSMVEGEGEGEGEEMVVMEREERPRRKVKRWFGIWE